MWLDDVRTYVADFDCDSCLRMCTIIYYVVDVVAVKHIVECLFMIRVLTYYRSS